MGVIAPACAAVLVDAWGWQWSFRLPSCWCLPGLHSFSGLITFIAVVFYQAKNVMRQMMVSMGSAADAMALHGDMSPRGAGNPSASQHLYG